MHRDLATLYPTTLLARIATALEQENLGRAEDLVCTGLVCHEQLCAAEAAESVQIYAWCVQRELSGSQSFTNTENEGCETRGDTHKQTNSGGVSSALWFSAVSSS